MNNECNKYGTNQLQDRDDLDQHVNLVSRFESEGVDVCKIRKVELVTMDFNQRSSILRRTL